MNIFDFGNMGEITTICLESSPRHSSRPPADPRQEMARKANRAIAKYEMFLRGFVGLEVSFFRQDLLNAFPVFNWLEAASIDENILRFRIDLLNHSPEHAPNRICYPLAFRNVYSKSAFRPYAIAEHVRMLDFALSIRQGTGNFSELECYWPEDPSLPIGLFLSNLADLYEKEHNFAEALAISGEMYRRGLLHWRPPHSIFWKLGRCKVGLNLYAYLKRQYSDRWPGAYNAWDIPTKELQRLSTRPYQAKRKNAQSSPTTRLLKYEGF
jgi:hypothetical protein